jgi:predicted Zn finger-like uncharacterized protein
MIIRCEKCGTKYRFDDALMDPEGAWVRCTRCENVFFQGNPRPEPAAPSEEEAAAPGPPPEDPDRTVLLSRGLQAGNASLHDDTVMLTADRIRETLREAEARRAAAGEPGEVPEAPPPVGEPREEEEPLPPPADHLKPRPSFLLITLAVFLAVVIGGSAFLFLYPDIRGALVSDLVAAVPALEAVFGKELPSGEVNPGDIRIQQVKRRLMANPLLGDLLILEGKALNTSPQAITRIRIQGRLYDPADRIIRSRISYAGNLLTDAELASLSEEDLQKRLSFPQITPPVKDSVAPGGTIPFMIVFALDRAGVDKMGIIKTGVIPLDAERMLP